jgi:D-serine deaminase-like pyridoxal phosphate-dependent protein
LAFVDFDLLDLNIRSLLTRAGNKKIRIASKSIRCKAVLEYILQSDKRFQGIMCYTAGEAAWLAENGFDDLLIGYPCVNKNDLYLMADRISKGKRIFPMVDDLAQAELLNTIAKEKNIKINICIDIDMSTDFPRVHFGVFRSPIHTVEDVKTLIGKLKQLSNIHVSAVMGYEAQTAGLGDNIEGQRFKNATIRSLKRRSNKDYKKRRGEIVEWLKKEGYDLELVNAGGTGSLELSAEEPWVTEVTIGSGFFSPGLFDHYTQFKHLPAAGFVLQIVRIPKNEYFTCLGGGYIASGPTGIIKQPYPYLPLDVQLLRDEGFGEVQTPFKYTGNIPLKIGDPILFRHAKAGELCEHFNYISVIKNNVVAKPVNTYRGDGKSFL